MRGKPVPPDTTPLSKLDMVPPFASARSSTKRFLLVGPTSTICQGQLAGYSSRGPTISKIRPAPRRRRSSIVKSRQRRIRARATYSAS